jgi:AhpD family alkylhydroperoxidase
MQLDLQTREVIAIGAAVGANCHSCLEYHVAKARETHLEESAIADAIEVGKMVRRGAQGKMDKLAVQLLAQAHAETAAADCACGS